MTQHEHHMEVYAIAILGTLKILTRAFLEASCRKDWIDDCYAKHSANSLDSVCEEAEELTEQRNKPITEQENAK